MTEENKPAEVEPSTALQLTRAIFTAIVVFGATRMAHDVFDQVVESLRDNKDPE